MKITQVALVSLFGALKFKGVADWAGPKLCQKLTKLSTLVPEDHGLDGTNAKLLTKLLAAAGKSQSVDVVDEEGESIGTATFANATPVEEPKPAKGGKDKANGDKPKGKGGIGVGAGGPGKPGIIATVKEMLQKASATAQVSKDEILRELVKRFPDKDADGMKVTVGIQCPSRLSAGGMKILKGENGYWAERGTKDEAKAVEKAEAAAAAKAKPAKDKSEKPAAPKKAKAEKVVEATDEELEDEDLDEVDEDEEGDDEESEDEEAA